MTEDLVQGWAPVYPHLSYSAPLEAIAWLTRVFGLRERVRMAAPDGTLITSKLKTPGGGLTVVAGSSPEFAEWIRERVPGFREQAERPWPYLTHTTTVIVGHVDAHHAQASAEGATILTSPTPTSRGACARTRRSTSKATSGSSRQCCGLRSPRSGGRRGFSRGRRGALAPPGRVGPP